MNLRRLIKEELEQVLNQNAAEKFDKDLVYLSGFTLKKKEEKGNFTMWIFEHKSKDYTIRFYIQKDKEKDSWVAKVFVYWKTPTKDFTNAKGKDYEYTFGPFSSYDDMIRELNRKLQNNPLISLSNYLDDNKTQFDNDVIEMLKSAKKHAEQINRVHDEHFKDLKKISKEIENINTIEGLREYAKKKAENEEDKQTLLLTLQKLYQLDFYMKMEQLKSLF